MGVAPPKSCVPSSNLSLQLIQSSITYALDFSIRLYICITYPRFVLKLVPRGRFHRLLPAALAQCLLVVVIGGRGDEDTWLLFVTASWPFVLAQTQWLPGFHPNYGVGANRFPKAPFSPHQELPPAMQDSLPSVNLHNS